MNIDGPAAPHPPTSSPSAAAGRGLPTRYGKSPLTRPDSDARSSPITVSADRQIASSLAGHFHSGYRGERDWRDGAHTSRAAPRNARTVAGGQPRPPAHGRRCPLPDVRVGLAQRHQGSTPTPRRRHRARRQARSGERQARSGEHRKIPIRTQIDVSAPFNERSSTRTYATRPCGRSLASPSRPASSRSRSLRARLRRSSHGSQASPAYQATM